MIDNYLVGIVNGRDIEWQEQAACGGTDTETFFPDKGQSSSTAKRICARCPVQRRCLAYALDLNERFGIWGATSERERRRLKTQGRAA